MAYSSQSQPAKQTEANQIPENIELAAQENTFTKQGLSRYVFLLGGILPWMVREKFGASDSSLGNLVNISLGNLVNIWYGWGRYLSAVGFAKLSSPEPPSAPLWVPVKFGRFCPTSPLTTCKIPHPPRCCPDWCFASHSIVSPVQWFLMSHPSAFHVCAVH